MIGLQMTRHHPGDSAKRFGPVRWFSIGETLCRGSGTRPVPHNKRFSAELLASNCGIQKSSSHTASSTSPLPLEQAYQFGFYGLSPFRIAAGSLSGKFPHFVPQFLGLSSSNGDYFRALTLPIKFGLLVGFPSKLHWIIKNKTKLMNKSAIITALQQSDRSTSPLLRLTSRQREILQRLAESQTTKAIALVLKLSDKTVEYHRAKLMARLDIFDIAGLVRFALRNGLISPET
jgi:DNA-binding CsgD family transcriptional regulator